jgi:PhnB protein
MTQQPEGYHTITPYLTVDDPEAALSFYERALGAERGLVLRMGDKIGHAEIKIGDSAVMLSGEYPPMDILSPKARGGTSCSLTVYVPDCDAAYQRAIAAGATAERPPEDQFYGDRMGSFKDPFGHRWSVHTHIRDVPEAEMQAAMDAWAASQGQAQPQAAEPQPA